MIPIDCYLCGEQADYIMSAPNIDGLHVGVNSDRWARMHEDVKETE